MVAHEFLEEIARGLLEDATAGPPTAGSERMGPRMPPTPPPADAWSGSDLLWVLPELLELLEDAHDQPVDHLAPMIRRRLLEQSFVDENGDSILEATLQADVDAQTRLLLHVLERVRAAAHEHGVWSDAPVTQLMCG